MMNDESEQQLREEIEDLKYCVKFLVNVLIDDESLLDHTKENLRGTFDEWLG